MIARAEIVKEDDSLTRDCDQCGHYHGYQVAAPVFSLNFHLPVSNPLLPRQLVYRVAASGTNSEAAIKTSAPGVEPCVFAAHSRWVASTETKVLYVPALLIR